MFFLKRMLIESNNDRKNKNIHIRQFISQISIRIKLTMSVCDLFYVSIRYTGDQLPQEGVTEYKLLCSVVVRICYQSVAL